LLALNEKQELFEIVKHKAIEQEPVFNRDLKHIDYTLVKDISNNKATNIDINSRWTKFNGVYEVPFINNRDKHLDILSYRKTNCAKYVLNEYIKCNNNNNPINHCSQQHAHKDNDSLLYRRALTDLDQKTIDDNKYKHRKMKKMKMKKNIKFNNPYNSTDNANDNNNHNIHANTQSQSHTQTQT